MSFYKIIDSDDQRRTIFDFAQKLYNSVDLDNTNNERYSIEKSIVINDCPDSFDSAHATIEFSIVDWDDINNHDGIVIDIQTIDSRDKQEEMYKENIDYIIKLKNIIESEYLPTITDEEEKLRINNILRYREDNKLLHDGNLSY